MSRWKLPTFSKALITSPDGEYVSALSSPSIPSCTSRGTGNADGKLVQVAISADGDDGTVAYNNFYNDRVWFGSEMPAV